MVANTRSQSGRDHVMATLQTRARVKGRSPNGDIDIVEKFMKVTGPVGQRRQRSKLEQGKGPSRQEKVRENIRKKLALEASAAKESGRGEENSDLQICFMNEIASDDEVLEAGGEDIPVVLAAEQIARLNISRKVNQIIVPMYRRPADDSANASSGEDSAREDQDPRHVTFMVEVKRLQNEARVGLKRAQEQAAIQISDEINTRKRNDELFTLLGIKECKKLNRRTLSRLNVGQLQVIQNNFLSQIESLNEELVNLLINRDEMVMEQDATLTDIEDVSEFINLKKY